MPQPLSLPLSSRAAGLGHHRTIFLSMSAAKDRMAQLRALEQALAAFIPIVAETEELRPSESAYRAYMEEISRLLSCGFSQKT